MAMLPTFSEPVVTTESPPTASTPSEEKDEYLILKTVIPIVIFFLLLALTAFVYLKYYVQLHSVQIDDQKDDKSKIVELEIPTINPVITATTTDNL